MHFQQCFVVVVKLREILTFSCLHFAPTLLSHHSLSTKAPILHSPLSSRLSYWLLWGNAHLQLHDPSLLYRLHWWGSDCKNQNTCMNGHDEPPAEPHPSLRRWTSNSHYSQPLGPYLSFSRKRLQSSWKTLNVGSSILAGNRTHRCRLYFQMRHS